MDYAETHVPPLDKRHILRFAVKIHCYKTVLANRDPPRLIRTAIVGPIGSTPCRLSGEGGPTVEFKHAPDS